MKSCIRDRPWPPPTSSSMSPISGSSVRRTSLARAFRQARGHRCTRGCRWVAPSRWRDGGRHPRRRVQTGATSAGDSRTVRDVEMSATRARRDASEEGVMLRNRVGGGRGGGTETVFQMRQKMFAIGDDFWIETNDGRRAFKVDGKALRIRKTLILEDASGQPHYTIKEKLVSIREVMTIDDAAGNPVATVKKALVSPLRERYNVELAAGGEWQAQGNILD